MRSIKHNKFDHSGFLLQAPHYASFFKLKVTGYSKIKFFSSVQDFFVIYSCNFKSPSIRIFRFKFSQFVPFLHVFDGFWGFSIKKGTHCEILNLKNWRLVRLKVHVIKQKSLVLMGETLQINYIFEWPPVTLSL